MSGAVKEERMNEIVVCWRWEVCRDGYVTKLWAYTEGGFKRRVTALHNMKTQSKQKKKILDKTNNTNLQHSVEDL